MKAQPFLKGVNKVQLKKIVELSKVNLLYANPQMIQKKRKKEEKTGQASKISAPASVLLNNLFILVLFMFLYSFMLGTIDFNQYPGFFTIYILMFSIMTILQGFYIIYNLFYESKDLEYYVPLPFTTTEIFLAKLIVIFLSVIPYLAPAGAVLFMAGRDAGRSVLPALLSAFLLFVLLMVVVFMLAIIFVHFITKLAIFQKHKKMMTTALYTISSIGMIAVVFFITNLSNRELDMPMDQVLPDYQAIPFIKAFHTTATQPLSQESLLGMAFWVIIVLGLGGILFKWIIPTFYQTSVDQPIQKTKKNEEVMSKESRKKSKKLGKQPETIHKILWKYNFGLIQDGTLMMQYLSSNLILPIFMLGPLLLGGNTIPEIPNYFWGLFFFAGFVYTFLTLNAVSVVGIIISLDRENFLYMKSLPFSMENYLKQKFLFAFSVQSSLPVLIVVILLFMAKIPLLFGICFILGLLTGLFTMSQFYFVRDYRFLRLDWQNLTELFGRGGGNFVQSMSIFGSVFVGIILITAFTFLLTSLDPVWRNLASSLMIFIPVVIAGSVTYRYEKKFWKQFTN